MIKKTSVFMSLAFVLCTALAMATDTPADATTVINAMSTGLTAAQSNLFQTLAAAIGLGLAVAGVIWGVRVGIRMFRSLSMGRGG